MGSAAEKLTKIERLNIAAKIAPWLRTLNKPVRRIGVVGPDGKVTRYTDTHAWAKLRLKLDLNIDLDAPGSLIETCPRCASLFVLTRPRQRYCSIKCNRAAAMAAWRSRNPGTDAERRDAWKRANPDKVRSHNRKASARRRAKNPELVQARIQAWKASHPEKVRQYRKAYQGRPDVKKRRNAQKRARRSRAK